MTSRVSSSFGYGWTYDVFLSFRGEDTRYGFTGNLYKALNKRGIHTFIDDEELQRGEQITPSLLTAIENSRIAIIVLSEHYASSSFCLDELAKIIECIKEKGRLVLPVFYDVDPSDVRNLRGSYGQALAKHEKKFKGNVDKLEKWKMALQQVFNLFGWHFKHRGSYGEALTMHEEKFKDNMGKLEKWRTALQQAANLSGWHFKHGNEYEYEFIGKIAEEVSSKIVRAALHVADYPVGLESQVLEVKSLLYVGSDDKVNMVGIYGIGGIGKTTIARALFNLIADQFDGLCFLHNVRENSSKHGLEHLQEKLLSETVRLNPKLGDVNEGIPIIKQRLHLKKVLLILDDVDKLKQLKAIVGAPDWFGSGSKVIITTRDKQLLACHGIKRTYEVKGLNQTDALDLLSWNAFKNDGVDPSLVDKLNRAVTYASGLPLALEVIGSNLFGKGIEEWESALDQYERIPNKNIQKILKVSFDALEEDEQRVFLDIACCFNGYRLSEVKDILRAHYDGHMQNAIGVLADKSLIKINFDTVTLHDLIQVMGREIVRQESPEDPGQRSRLWFVEDIVQVLRDNTGTSKIQIIVLDKFEKVDWDVEAFKKMNNLKTLIIIKGLSEGPKYLPSSLRVLEWRGYPSQSLPADFNPRKLTIFKLPESCLMSLTLPESPKKFENMRVLNFDSSQEITEIPNVSSVPNLEELSFRKCIKLTKIHDSVGLLNKLRILDAWGCKELRSFPPIKLSSLEYLELSFCSSLESFPEILGKMENITELELRDTPIKELPFSIRNLTRLQTIGLYSCGMVQLPSSILMLPELEELRAENCEGLRLSKQDEGDDQVSSIVSSNMERLVLSSSNISDEFLPIGLAWFANVKELDLSHNNFTILPACIKECRFLGSLTLNCCKLLREIRGIPPNLETLHAAKCTSLKDLDLTLLPACTKECRFLTGLYLDDCENLQEIRGIPPNMEIFSAPRCRSLTPSCTSMLLNQELHEEGENKMFCLPGTRIPEWFEHSSRGPSISFWFRNKFPAISLCFFIPQQGDCYYFDRDVDGPPTDMIINGNEVKGVLPNPGRVRIERGHVVIFGRKQIKFEDYMEEVILENDWNHVVVYFKTWTDPCSVQIGLQVFKQKSSMEDILFTDPLLLKEKHRVDTKVSRMQFMQQPKNLASLPLLEPHVGHGGDWLSLLPPPAFKSLNDSVNWDSNSMVSTQTSSTTGVQGCEIALRKRKLGVLGLDNEANKHFCQAPSKVVLGSDSIMSSFASDNANEGGL